MALNNLGWIIEDMGNISSEHLKDRNSGPGKLSSLNIRIFK